jgi:hypothetical protein
MSQLATTVNYADRRRDFRHPVSRTAELLLPGNQTVYSCTILDESDGGVQLETTGTSEPPEQALIRFSPQSSQLLRRCWANGTRAGYQYIKMVPAKRRSQEETVSPFGQTDAAALNVFMQIAHTLLDLSDSSAHWLQQTDQIEALLAQMPHARLHLEQPGADGHQAIRLFAIPHAPGNEAASFRTQPTLKA